MNIRHDTLVPGNCFSFTGGFFGFSSIVLIEADAHPPVLFDTGHHSTRTQLLEALARRQLSPADIGTVFLSHLHFDHINNVDLFPDATFHVSKTEWEYAHSPAHNDHFCSVGMNEYLSRRRLNLIHETEGQLLPGLHFRHAPGHTPGGYLLHFINANSQRVVIAGDACKTYRELATLSVASEFDPLKRSADTLAWIADNADIVIPGHFPEMVRGHGGWHWEQPSSLELIAR